MQYLLASFSCNLFYEVFYFLWLFHHLHLAENPIIGCLLVGSFVMNFPIFYSMICYICFLAVLAISFQFQLFSYFCRQDIKVALHNMTYESKTNLKNIYFSKAYERLHLFSSIVMNREQFKVCWCFESYYSNLPLFTLVTVLLLA